MNGFLHERETVYDFMEYPNPEFVHAYIFISLCVRVCALLPHKRSLPFLFDLFLYIPV